jgi:hypothetical protein
MKVINSKKETKFNNKRKGVRDYIDRIQSVSRGKKSGYVTGGERIRRRIAEARGRNEENSARVN